MQINQLTEQEQVLVMAFRNNRPAMKEILVGMATTGAIKHAKEGPHLSLVPNSPLPPADPFERRLAG
jgi:hypothetical protein